MPISPSAAPTNISMAAPARRPSSMSRPGMLDTARPPCPAGSATKRPSPSTSTTAPATASTACASARRRSSRSPCSMPRSTPGTACRWTMSRAASIGLCRPVHPPRSKARCPDLTLATPARRPCARQPGLVPPSRGLRHHAGADRPRRDRRFPRARHRSASASRRSISARRKSSARRRSSKTS